MRMLVWFLLVAGCKTTDSSTPAPAAPPTPPAADAMRVAQLSSDAAVGGDAAVGLDAAASPDAPDTPHVVDLVAMPMAGPFATRAQLCAIQTCTPDPRNGPQAAALHVDCRNLPLPLALTTRDPDDLPAATSAHAA